MALMRDRLIELINRAKQLYKEDIAFDTIDGAKMPTETDYIIDYLLAKGVVCPPCKVGDMVYQVYDIFNEKVIEELKVLEITSDTKGIKTIYASTKTGSIYCFSRDYNLSNIKFTKEEAEKYLREKELNEGTK